MEACGNIRKSRWFHIKTIDSKTTRKSEEMVSGTIIPIDWWNLVVRCKNLYVDRYRRSRVQKSRNGVFDKTEKSYCFSVDKGDIWLVENEKYYGPSDFFYQGNTEHVMNRTSHKKEDVICCCLLEVKLLKEAQSYSSKWFNICMVQWFNGSLLRSTNDISLLKWSNFYQLDTFIDDNGFLKVGGRLEKSKLNKDTVHPVLFPEKNEITNAIAQWFHKASLHGWRGISLNKLQQSWFWVIHGNATCRSIIRYCVTCSRFLENLATVKPHHFHIVVFICICSFHH